MFKNLLRRKSAKPIEVEPNRYHDFKLYERLEEPGISDIDGGQWARRRAHCSQCGANRKVWQLVPLRDLNLGPCPDPKDSHREVVA